MILVLVIIVKYCKEVIVITIAMRSINTNNHITTTTYFSITNKYHLITQTSQQNQNSSQKFITH